MQARKPLSISNSKEKAVKLLIKKLALLAFLLTLVIMGLNFLGVRAGTAYKDGAALVCQTKREMVRDGTVHYKKNKVNVLFLGTSRILAGIAPVLFDELSGKQTFSYNLALPALPISSSYFLLRDWLEKNPAPQYIVMELYTNRCHKCALFNYYANQGLVRWDEMLSLFFNSPSKTIVLDFIFPFRMYKFFTIRYLYHRIFQPSRLRQVQDYNRAILDRVREERGYYFIEEQAVSSDNRLPANFMEEEQANHLTKKMEFDPFMDPYVERFFDLTAEKGIKVLLIQPAYRKHQLLQYEKKPQQWEAILRRYSHVYISHRGWELTFYENQLFSDKTHLNRDGSRQFTWKIYRQFHEVFGQGVPNLLKVKQ
jgi:hypothetical protein